MLWERIVWERGRTWAEVDNSGHISILAKANRLSVNILKYWEDTKFTYHLSEILHSVPATQISVNWAFSALKWVTTDLRCNLFPDSIRKIVIIRLEIIK